MHLFCPTRIDPLASFLYLLRSDSRFPNDSRAAQIDTTTNTRDVAGSKTIAYQLLIKNHGSRITPVIADNSVQAPQLRQIRNSKSTTAASCQQKNAADEQPGS